MSDPIPNAQELLEDRIKFKFYAVENHLKLLRELQAKGVTPNNLEGRVKWEIEIENIISHLIGARDALLVSINKKHGSPLDIGNINPTTMCDKFGFTDLKELCDLLELDPKIYPNGSWLKILNNIRNTGMHRNVINLRHEVELKEDLNTGRSSSSPMMIYFKDDPDSKLEVIQYLEDRFQKMKRLIENILSSN